MKKSLLIVFYSLFSALFLSGCLKKKTPELPSQTRPKIQEPVNTVPLEERIYSTLEITSGGQHPTGREITLAIFGGIEASKIEYELEYQTGTLVQAGLGSIVPAEEKLPFSRDILLGSCSAGGACNYHEDVKGGTLLLRFGDSSVGTLKGEWNYYQPGNDGRFSSRDAKFQLEAAKLKSSYVVIAQTIGLPKSVDGKVLAGPYHLDTTATSIGKMELTLRLSEESETATLWLWTGKSYHKVTSQLTDKTLTATISSSGTYLVTE